MTKNCGNPNYHRDGGVSKTDPKWTPVWVRFASKWGCIQNQVGITYLGGAGGGYDCSDLTIHIFVYTHASWFNSLRMMWKFSEDSMGPQILSLQAWVRTSVHRAWRSRDRGHTESYHLYRDLSPITYIYIYKYINIYTVCGTQ